MYAVVDCLGWPTWAASCQRHAAGRPAVLTHACNRPTGSRRRRSSAHSTPTRPRSCRALLRSWKRLPPKPPCAQQRRRTRPRPSRGSLTQSGGQWLIHGISWLLWRADAHTGAFRSSQSLMRVSQSQLLWLFNIHRAHAPIRTDMHGPHPLHSGAMPARQWSLLYTGPGGIDTGGNMLAGAGAVWLGGSPSRWGRSCWAPSLAASTPSCSSARGCRPRRHRLPMMMQSPMRKVWFQPLLLAVVGLLPSHWWRH